MQEAVFRCSKGNGSKTVRIPSSEYFSGIGRNPTPIHPARKQKASYRIGCHKEHEEPPSKSFQVRQKWNPLALAFLGDAVWELYVRRREFYDPHSNLTSIHDACSAETRAERQAEIVNRLIDGKFLTDDERDVLRWGRNANKSLSPKRAITLAKGDYRKSTAFECLLGFLYLSDVKRLHDLMIHLGYVHATNRERPIV